MGLNQTPLRGAALYCATGAILSNMNVLADTIHISLVTSNVRELITRTSRLRVILCTQFSFSTILFLFFSFIFVM